MNNLESNPIYELVNKYLENMSNIETLDDKYLTKSISRFVDDLMTIYLKYKVNNRFHSTLNLSKLVNADITFDESVSINDEIGEKTLELARDVLTYDSRSESNNTDSLDTVSLMEKKLENDIDFISETLKNRNFIHNQKKQFLNTASNSKEIIHELSENNQIQSDTVSNSVPSLNKIYGKKRITDIISNIKSTNSEKNTKPLINIGKTKIKKNPNESHKSKNAYRNNKFKSTIFKLFSKLYSPATILFMISIMIKFATNLI